MACRKNGSKSNVNSFNEGTKIEKKNLCAYDVEASAYSKLELLLHLENAPVEVLLPSSGIYTKFIGYFRREVRIFDLKFTNRDVKGIFILFCTAQTISAILGALKCITATLSLSEKNAIAFTVLDEWRTLSNEMEDLLEKVFRRVESEVDNSKVEREINRVMARERHTTIGHLIKTLTEGVQSLGSPQEVSTIITSTLNAYGCETSNTNHKCTQSLFPEYDS